MMMLMMAIMTVMMIMITRMRMKVYLVLQRRGVHVEEFGV